LNADLSILKDPQLAGLAVGLIAIASSSARQAAQGESRTASGERWPAVQIHRGRQRLGLC
jgi:hypothetical protein